jgi:hypothetical protein
MIQIEYIKKYQLVHTECQGFLLQPVQPGRGPQDRLCD